ncbi:EamA family transporter [Priestia megaterium]|nr:EamA family transporter [Priestia megaterium]
MIKNIPGFYILIAAVLWGTTGTAQSVITENAHPVAVGTIRLAIGGGALLAVVFIQKQKIVGKETWPIASILIASLSMAAYQPLFFSAVKMTGVAVGTVIAIGSAPIIAGMLEFAVYRHIPRTKWWIATGLAIIGCFLMFGNENEGILSIAGIFMALGAGFSFACYTLVNKRIISMIRPEVAVAVVFTGAAIILSPFLFMHNMKWLFSLNGLLVSIHLGVITTGLSYVLFSKGLKKTNTSTAVTLALAEPATATLLGITFIGEKLTALGIMGIICLFISLILLAYPSRINKAVQVHT